MRQPSYAFNDGLEMRRANHKRSWDEGAAAVETAIALFVLLLMILGIIEFGTALYSYNTMQLAVEQAGRYAMLQATIPPTNVPPPCNTVACAEAKMKTILTTAAVCAVPAAGQICVNATPPAGANPPTMTLTAAYNFNFIGFGGPFTMTAQGTFPLD
jgi:Flp pilus assembly protein TadG